MDIRQGTIQDVTAVRALICALTVDRTDIVTTGFVEYPLPHEEAFTLLCADNPLFLVAEVEDTIAGFFLGFTNDRLALRENLNVAEQRIFSLFNHFVYGELMGVASQYQQQGLAQDIFERVFDYMREEGYIHFFGCVVHAPLANFASLKLMERTGQELVEEVIANDGLVFGIYKKIV